MQLQERSQRQEPATQLGKLQGKERRGQGQLVLALALEQRPGWVPMRARRPTAALGLPAQLVEELKWGHNTEAGGMSNVDCEQQQEI